MSAILVMGVHNLIAGSLPSFPVMRPFSRHTLQKDQTYVPKAEEPITNTQNN